MSSAASTAAPPAAGGHAEDLSRMEGEFGAKMMGKLKQMDVLVSGLRGLGVETAKNLILAGPHSVTVHDDEPAKIADVGANFYITEGDVGKPRGKVVIKQLGELNPNVNVRLHTGAINESDIQKYDVVVFTNDAPIADLIRYNDAARRRSPTPTTFIAGSLNGVTGFIFADFGPAHHCFDDNGVAVRSVIIDDIFSAKNGVITVDGDRHLLNDGDWIKFEEVRGMSDAVSAKHAEAVAKGRVEDPPKEVSDIVYEQTDVIVDINQIHVVKTTKNPKKFTIGDTTKLGEYKGGGIATQVKKPLTFNFSPLSAQLHNPSLLPTYMDFSKFGRDIQLHVSRLAAWRFQATHSHFPRLHHQNDAAELVATAKAIVSEQKEGPLKDLEVDPSVVTRYALYAQAELAGQAALFGGVLAQEITKFTGKYTPIQQWFHFDAFELLDDAPPADSKPIGSRYDHQISIFGRAFQDRLLGTKTFLVGAGALGCEYMKAFALTGLGCDHSKGGQIHVTDDDRIELSNLSRQFLFRRHHVGKPKSSCAAEAAIAMNPALAQSLKAMETRVEYKNENIFDDKFWDSLDFVVNALDNQIARKYVDGKCVLHGKPLFESGTLGTQANSVICLPGKTPSYSEGAVAGEEQGVAQCTLRNFPSEITHCIEWAREKFNDLYVSGADTVNSFLEDRSAFLAKLKQDRIGEADALRTVKIWLDYAANPTFDTCIKIILDEFTASFRNAIKDLTHHFPEDARVIEKDTGVDLGPFWRGHKRFPSAAEFDPNNPLHIDYVFAGANILASVFGLKEKSRDAVVEATKSYKAAVWTPGKVDVDEKKGGEEEKKGDEPPKVNEEDEAVVARLTPELIALNLGKYKKLAPADFEKDNDANHHIDWITAATNLRAFNYQLKPATRQKCRLTAGKIIPAIATTTASITGFITTEIYKYVKRVALENHRACTINLGTNVVVCENLPDPLFRKSGFDQLMQMDVVAVPEKHTCWDQIVIDKPGLTLKQFCDEFQRVHHGCTIDSLMTYGLPKEAVLFSSQDLLMKSKKALIEKRLATPLIEVYEEIAGKVFPPTRNYLTLDSTVETENGDSGIVPLIKYIFRH